MLDYEKIEITDSRMKYVRGQIDPVRKKNFIASQRCRLQRHTIFHFEINFMTARNVSDDELPCFFLALFVSFLRRKFHRTYVVGIFHTT